MLVGLLPVAASEPSLCQLGLLRRLVLLGHRGWHSNTKTCENSQLMSLYPLCTPLVLRWKYMATHNTWRHLPFALEMVHCVRIMPESATTCRHMHWKSGIACVGALILLVLWWLRLPNVEKSFGNKRPDQSFMAIATRLGNDKVFTHSYQHLYDKYLESKRDQKMRFMEIGLGCNMAYGPGVSYQVHDAGRFEYSIMGFVKNATHL